MDGSDLRIVIPNGYASHFIWRDPTHILSQAKGWLGNDAWGNFLFEDRDSGIVAEIGKGVLDSGGHVTYLRNNEWILNDTYPRARSGSRRRISTTSRQTAASIWAASISREYSGEWRVDTHPRLSRDERVVCIDSPHTGQGRQLHLIEISGVS